MKKALSALAFAATLATCTPIPATAAEPVSGPLAAANAEGTDATPMAVDGRTEKPGPLVVPDPADDVQGNLGRMYEAVRSGRWLAAIAAGILLAVFVVRRFLLKRVAWFQTRAGGWTINFALAAFTAVAVEMQMGVLGLATILDALALGFTAAGVYEGVRDPTRPTNPDAVVVKPAPAA